MSLKRGYIQIYTGNGKGKTTAAFGQALRAAGSGLKTFILLFMKNSPYGAMKIFEQIPNWVTFEHYGNDSFVFFQIKRQVKKTSIWHNKHSIARAKPCQTVNSILLLWMRFALP